MYVSMSTVDDFSYTPSLEERTRDAAQVIATGRQNWKTLKGRSEAVWPPNVEAALIEALEKYQPHSTKVLGRFPMRNKFISDYIFGVTGKRRTPKQVGSRLQQLRDTCRGKQIFHLISDRPRDPGSRTSSPCSSSQISTPPPDLNHPSRRCEQPRARRLFIHVDIQTDSEPWPSTFPVINIVDHDHESTPRRIRLTSLPAKVSHIYAMDATVTFVSPCPLSPTTSFSVFFDGISAPVHTEVAPLVCYSSPLQGCGWLYRTTLIPAFWSMLCNSGDLSSYTIWQDLASCRSSANGLSYSENSTTFTLVYRFEYPYTLSTLSAHPHSIHQRHVTEDLPTPGNADYAIQSFSSNFITSLVWGSDYHHPSDPMVQRQSLNLMNLSHCGVPTTIQDSSHDTSQTPNCNLDTTLSGYDFSCAYDTSAMPTISQPGRMTSFSDYIPESARLASRDTCLVGQSRSWPSSSIFYGDPSDSRPFWHPTP